MRSALKKRSAISPINKGAIIAPQDWVEKAIAVSAPEAPRLLPKKVPKVTNQPPQIKNWRNIIKESWILVDKFILVVYCLWLYDLICLFEQKVFSG